MVSSIILASRQSSIASLMFFSASFFCFPLGVASWYCWHISNKPTFFIFFKNYIKFLDIHANPNTIELYCWLKFMLFLPPVIPFFCRIFCFCELFHSLQFLLAPFPVLELFSFRESFDECLFQLFFCCAC